METTKNRLNIFLDLDTMKAYLDDHVPEELELQKVFVDCAYTVDITDAPHRLFYRAGQKNIELELNRRGIMYMSEETESLKEAHLSLAPSGQVQGNAPQELQNVMQLYLMFCLNFSAWLREQSVFSKYSELNPETQGLVLEEKAGLIKLRPVSGDERPDLACRLFTGDVKMMRPYSTDVMRGVILDAVPLEKKEAEAEAGDTRMMRHLFEYYMGNNVSAHKDLERNSKKLLNLMKTASGETPDDNVEEENEEDTRNPEKAFYWLKKLAESGDAEAMNELSAFYMKAFGTKRDLKKAAEWKKKAVENGSKGEAAMEQALLSSAESEEKAEAGDAEAQANYAKLLALFAQYRPDLGSETDEKEAFRWAQKAAAGANPVGIMTLAQFYQDGTGTSKDDRKAFRLIERAAQKGDAACQAKLGQMYFGGEGVEENPEAAFEWCKKAAEAGDINGMSNLGVLYLLGKGVEKNPDKAVEWLQKAAALGDDGAKMALEKLGIPLNPQKDDKQPRTIEEAIQMAEQGSVEAMKMLAGYYVNRPGGREDLAEAEKWAKMAADRGDEEAKETLRQLQDAKKGKLTSFTDAKSGAEKGDPSAQYLLASYYICGYQTERDLVQALYWMKKAAAAGRTDAKDYINDFRDIEKIQLEAEQGDAKALGELAQKYIALSNAFTLNREQTIAEGLAFAQHAAELGDAKGQHVLGYSYENGIGTEVDFDRAFELYKKSAEQGYTSGELALATCYLLGHGTVIDPEAALIWLARAEEHGDPEAVKAKEIYAQIMFNMGMDKMVDGAKSGGRDPALGARLIQCATKLNSDPARYSLGLMYINGKGVEQDFEAGIALIKESAETGNEKAKESLKEYDTPKAYLGASLKETMKKEKADREKAYRLIKHAVEAGYTPAYSLFGNMIINGYGTVPDYECGIDWIQKAIACGDEKAKETLRKCQSPDGLFRAARALINYSKKQNIENSPEALALLQRAAEAGSAEAYNVMAGIYASPEKAAAKYPIIVEKDTHKAREYLEKAIALEPGLEHLQNNLQKLTEEENNGHSELHWKVDMNLKRAKISAETQPSDTPVPAQSAPPKEEPPAADPEKTTEPPAVPQPKPETEEEKQARLKGEYQKKGLCRYCGGEFKKGLFSTKCSRCGKKKDY